MKLLKSVVFSLFLLCCCVSLMGLSNKPSIVAFKHNPDVAEFAKDYAKKHQKNEKQILALLSKAEYKQSIIDAISRPAESVLEWKDYSKIFLKLKRVKKGVAFWKKHQAALLKVSQLYQVDPEVIVAILGVETWYGENQGSFRVLDALMTLSFHYPKRAKFFKKELEHFLLLIDEQKLDGTQLKGSYAGAMGYGQFMPSSYRAYAKSYKGNGPVDIWHNPEDAIASIANYLHEHHWRYGDLIALQLPIKNIKQDWLSKKLKPVKVVGDYNSLFKLPASVSTKAPVTLMEMQGHYGKEYWFGFNNFYVISRYNISRLYSLSVFQLSQLIKFEMSII